MILRAILLLAALTGLVSCEGGLLAPPDHDPAVRTSADEYVLETTPIGWETQIPYTYANRSEGSYYLVNCNGGYWFDLQKRVDDRWVLAYSPVLPACRSPVIRFGPGSVFSSSIPVFAGFPGNNWHPKFEIAEPTGTYRIVLHTLSSYDEDAYPFGEELPLEDRVSNEFRLVTADSPTD
jgi:hypothetical protein